VIPIDVLPDDVLLEIFDFYANVHEFKTRTDGWQSLVHVCRRWRSLVFESPRRLNLQLYCTPARGTLDIWPALPLIIAANMASPSGTDNVIAALEQSNRVRKVTLVYPAAWQLEKVLAAMQVPFPELTDLQLISGGETETLPVIPDSFLDGSAPRLRIFTLSGISFPGLPKLLLSATHLVNLQLSDIPHSGCISPEAMVALLFALSSLETLGLVFQSPQSHPDWESRILRPPKRSVLLALIIFQYRGVIEYLEDLVALIDAPQLKRLDIGFRNQIDFDAPRLAQFINRTATFRLCDEAHVHFDNWGTGVALLARYSTLKIEISCGEPRWQLSFVAQICNSSLHSLFTVETLYIEHQISELVWKVKDIENTLWLQLLLPFTTVKNLYLSKGFAPSIAATLQELVGGRITEVLPSLQNIFVEELEPLGPFQENIGQFVATRQLSDHPIAICFSIWDTIRS
jgi:hypothetical protein